MRFHACEQPKPYFVAIPLLAPHVLGRLCLREPRWRLPGIEPRKHRGGINETFDKVPRRLRGGMAEVAGNAVRDRLRGLAQLARLDRLEELHAQAGSAVADSTAGRERPLLLR
jgi:hypothetical protein